MCGRRASDQSLSYVVLQLVRAATGPPAKLGALVRADQDPSCCSWATELLAGAVLIASVPPFSVPPQADLSGRRVLISNGENDFMARPDQTVALAGQLSERRAQVQVLTHPGGHQLVPDHLPAMQALVQTS